MDSPHFVARPETHQGNSSRPSWARLDQKDWRKQINKTNQQWFQSYLYVDRNKTWDNSASTSIQKTLKLRLRWGCGVGAVTVFHEYFTRTPIKSNIRLLTFHPRTNANKTPGEENKPRTNAREGKRKKVFPSMHDPLLEVHKVIHPIQYGI